MVVELPDRFTSIYFRSRYKAISTLMYVMKYEDNGIDNGISGIHVLCEGVGVGRNGSESGT